MDPENDIKHGEAVALDILFSCFLSYERKLLSYKDLIRIIKLTHSAHLPIDLSIFDTKTMWNSVLERMDHRDGMQNIPIPNGIGKCIFINDLTQIDLMNALKSYHNIFLQQKLPASVD
jgi:3-dehydroquinate synthase